MNFRKTVEDTINYEYKNGSPISAAHKYVATNAKGY